MQAGQQACLVVAVDSLMINFWCVGEMRIQNSSGVIQLAVLGISFFSFVRGVVYFYLVLIFATILVAQQRGAPTPFTRAQMDYISRLSLTRKCHQSTNIDSGQSLVSI